MFGGIRPYVEKRRYDGATWEQISKEVSGLYGRKLTDRTIVNWYNRWKQKADDSQSEPRDKDDGDETGGTLKGTAVERCAPSRTTAPGVHLPQRRRSTRSRKGVDADPGVRGDAGHEVAIAGGVA
jgi:hypothetical protein